MAVASLSSLSERRRRGTWLWHGTTLENVYRKYINFYALYGEKLCFGEKYFLIFQHRNSKVLVARSLRVTRTVRVAISTLLTTMESSTC